MARPFLGLTPSRVRRLALLAGCALLAACSGPIDSSLETGTTPQAYRASLDAVFAQLTPHEQEAFNWAVSDFDLPKLHAKYPGGSPADIIRGEVADVLDTYPDKIDALKPKVAAQAPLRADLAKIASNPGMTWFRIDDNFFGLQPRIATAVENRSQQAVSRLQWRAALYLDGADSPVVTTILTDDYQSEGGLKPGMRKRRLFTVGFVKGDQAWTTLEIRNAKSRRVVLEPVLGSVEDFGGRVLLPEDPAAQIERMEGAIAAAESFRDI
jgi:hypothetical protein